MKVRFDGSGTSIVGLYWLSTIILNSIEDPNYGPVMRPSEVEAELGRVYALNGLQAGVRLD